MIVVLVGLSEVQIKELPEGIIGITRTHNATELAEIYSAAGVFVDMTYQDTYPTVNLEALSCGTPIVTYDTGGSVEAGDETCCVIVPQNDLTAVVKTIEKARLLSREAALYTSRNYLFDNKYLDYNSLYKECL